MSTIPLYLLEPDSPAPAWAPFAGARPLAELRAGVWRIRDRWSAALGTAAVATIGAHTEDFADVDSLPVRAPGPIPGPAVVARSTFVPTPGAEAVGTVRRLVHLGETVAWFVAAGETWNGPDDRGTAAEIDGLALAGAWDLVTALERLLPSDCSLLVADEDDGVPPGSIVLGNPGRLLWRGATVEPGVVFDLRHGGVVLEPGSEVRSGTRLEGPLYAGEGTWLLGGFLRNSVFGPHCRIHGEVASSVFNGYANKSHDGFVGHSVLGHWVNLGAGTITSNLKNTYGLIRLDLADGPVETGRTNLGSLIGDHAKTAIGTLLATGTVVGTGASVHGAPPVPRMVPPFAWGATGKARVDVERFVRLASRVMPRRGVNLTPDRERSLRAIRARLGG